MAISTPLHHIFLFWLRSRILMGWASNVARSMRELISSDGSNRGWLQVNSTRGKSSLLYPSVDQVASLARSWILQHHTKEIRIARDNMYPFMTSWVTRLLCNTSKTIIRGLRAPLPGPELRRTMRKYEWLIEGCGSVWPALIIAAPDLPQTSSWKQHT